MNPILSNEQLVFKRHGEITKTQFSIEVEIQSLQIKRKRNRLQYLSFFTIWLLFIVAVSFKKHKWVKTKVQQSYLTEWVQCVTCRISVLFSMPSSNQASRMCSTGVKPVPSSRVEKRRIPMVLVRADGVAILRPPSSKGCTQGNNMFLLEIHHDPTSSFRCNLLTGFKLQIFDTVGNYSKAITNK